MAPLTLKIPHALNDFPMKHGEDSLWIEVTEECDWCYDDRDGCFGPSPNGFLAAGHYKKTDLPNPHGPYPAIKAGKVPFNAVTSGDCTLNHKIETAHSIIVS